jgi:8-oxo-dGTP pyrophosphatase MutT (NUDIX family)
MPVEKSAGAVIFRKEKDTIKYLLLHYPGFRGKSHWDFPKGNIEKGESLTETVKREVEEETGIKGLIIIKGFKETIKYFFRFKGKDIFKIVVFFLAETKQGKVKISWEHKGFKWLPYKKALEQLTFKNAKEILKKANDFLSKQGL